MHLVAYARYLFLPTVASEQPAVSGVPFLCGNSLGAARRARTRIVGGRARKGARFLLKMETIP